MAVMSSSNVVDILHKSYCYIDVLSDRCIVYKMNKMANLVHVILCYKKYMQHVNH